MDFKFEVGKHLIGLFQRCVSVVTSILFLSFFLLLRFLTFLSLLYFFLLISLDLAGKASFPRRRLLLSWTLDLEVVVVNGVVLAGKSTCGVLVVERSLVDKRVSIHSLFEQIEMQL